MEQCILEHYRQTGTFTYAGGYKDYFRSLPDDIPTLGRLICSQVIHRVTLREGNGNANQTLLYGDMNRYPWYRMRCEDDIFLTATAMTGELFRLDDRGFVRDRQVEHKLVVTCRYVSVLVSAILKAKGIPARSRAGFAPYFKEGAFDWAAKAYLAVRSRKTDGKQYVYADGLGTCSLPAIIRYLIYDFHALMNNELTYSFLPAYLDGRLDGLTEKELTELDRLAEYLMEPDRYFDELCGIWNRERKFRVLNSPLVGAYDHGAEFSY